MKRVKLGPHEISEICLGTMTFGQQNNEIESHALLDYAFNNGINFFDCAELYPVPTRAETQGLSEKYIGSWLKKNEEKRDKLVIATKCAGYSTLKWINKNRIPSSDGEITNLSYDSIMSACNTSLLRLQTSYIDIYYLHWPDRYKPSFGDNLYDAKKERKENIPVIESLKAIKKLLEEGKIKSYGVSNETAWGMSLYKHAAIELNMQLPLCIQNSYSLLHRAFESELCEACRPMNTNCPLIAWSPLCGGSLTGKYLSDYESISKADATSRFIQFKETKYQARFWNTRSLMAIEKYGLIAKKYNMSLTQLALAFVKTRFFCVSTLLGATTITQLQENIAAFSDEIYISEACEKEINQIFMDHRDPTLEYF